MRITLSTSVTSSLGANVEHAEMVANTTVSLIQTSGLSGLPSTELLGNASELLPPFFNYMLSTVKANKRIYFVSLATSRPYAHLRYASSRFARLSAKLEHSPSRGGFGFTHPSVHAGDPHLPTIAAIFLASR